MLCLARRVVSRSSLLLRFRWPEENTRTVGGGVSGVGGARRAGPISVSAPCLSIRSGGMAIRVEGLVCGAAGGGRVCVRARLGRVVQLGSPEGGGAGLRGILILFFLSFYVWWERAVVRRLTLGSTFLRFPRSFRPIIPYNENISERPNLSSSSSPAAYCGWMPSR